MHRHGRYRLLGLCSALLASLMLASVAEADDPVRRATRIELEVVASPAPEAPRNDVERTQARVEGQLWRSRGRIRECLAELDLREDPLRSRARRMEIHARLTRTGRPERVWVHHQQGVPTAARRCLLEAVRAIAVRPAPRGDVLVRVVYTLH